MKKIEKSPHIFDSQSETLPRILIQNNSSTISFFCEILLTDRSDNEWHLIITSRCPVMHHAPALWLFCRMFLWSQAARRWQMTSRAHSLEVATCMLLLLLLLVLYNHQCEQAMKPTNVSYLQNFARNWKRARRQYMSWEINRATKWPSHCAVEFFNVWKCN